LTAIFFAELTKGHRLTIAGAMLAAAVIWTIADMALPLIVRVLTRNAGLTGLASLPPLILSRAFMCVMIAVIYYGLRANEEGAAVDSLTDVFD
jgi:hypothetical protein